MKFLIIFYVENYNFYLYFKLIFLYLEFLMKITKNCCLHLFLLLKLLILTQTHNLLKLINPSQLF